MTRRLHPSGARVAALVPLGLALALIAGPTSAASAAALGASDAPAPSPAPSAAPADGGTAEPVLATFGITSASGGLPDARSFIAVGGAPGSVIYDNVAVVNQSDEALDLDVYAADAVSDANGTVGLAQRATTGKGAGTWVTLGAAAVTVPPQSDKGIGYTLVPVTISIPPDAEPGDHLAGVVAALVSSSTSDGSRKATVDLEQRTGARVYINVAGAQRPSLAVSNVHGAYAQGKGLGLAGPGTLTVSYTLTNDGNVRVGAKPSIRAGGPFGLLAHTVGGRVIDELLPGASVDQTVTVPNVWPLLVDPITVSATATAAIGRDDPGVGTVQGSGYVWAVPWALFAIVLVLVGCWLLLRRRRQRRPGRPPRHSSSSGGARPPVLPPTAAATRPTASPQPHEPQAVP